MGKKSGEYSKGGSEILRHAPREQSFEVAVGDQGGIEAVERHFARWIGEPAWVFHEIISDLVHLDVHVIEPSPERETWTLFTSGMSDRRMTIDDDELAWAELMIMLPASWKVDEASFKDERWYWPIRWLKMMARLPHEYGTWLGRGHTVPNGDPPEPFGPGTEFCCMWVLPPISLPEEALSFSAPQGHRVNIYALYPLYGDEVDVKLSQGTDALIDLFEAAGITDVVDVSRKSAAP